jgi:molecular chaperone GrpE
MKKKRKIEILHEEGAPEPEADDTAGNFSESVEHAEPEIVGHAEPEGTEQLKSRLAYLMAEFDNFRKRTEREREAQVAYGNEKLLLAMLPFLDNLERAMEQKGTSSDAILTGVRMAYDSLLADLGKFGLLQVSSEGKLFDPLLHEAVGIAPGTGAPEGTVVYESRKGYMLNGRLLRPAQVMVAAASSPDEADA